ncbi:MAG: hypothetical protein CMJ58_01470 [Planctomycetaceae bacterium]|nr:hypothetical protein [Planctomycetaceae bacterium]
MSERDQLNDLVESLKQERDELKLRMHLAGMEVRDEYERLSGRVSELNAQFEPVREATEDAAGNVFAALMLAADEMKNGFQRIRQAVKDS